MSRPPLPDPTDQPKADADLSSLSERERQVLSLIGEGLSTEAVARRLGRRLETVRSHRRAIGKKLGISSRVDLVRFAIRSGLCSVREQMWSGGGATSSDRLWLLASAAQSTAVPLAIIAGDGTVRFVNDAFQHLTGADRAGVPGRPLSSLLSDGEAVAQSILDRARAGEVIETVTQLHLADGTRRAAGIVVTALRDESASPIGLTLAVVDAGDPGRRSLAVAAATQSLEATVRERTAQLESVVALLRQEVQSRRRIESRMQAVLEGVAAATGSTFFQLLVRHLAAALHVSHAAVVEVVPGSEQRARTVAFWNGDRLGHDREFDLAGSLCEMVLEGKPSFYPSGIRMLFGPEHILGRLPVDSYLGVALVDSEGRRMGVLAIMDEEPMPDAMEHVPILRAFAARASGELERRRSEAARMESEGRYRILAELSPIGVFVMNAALECTYVNARWREITGLHELPLPARACDRVLHPEDRDRVRVALEAAVRAAAPFESEHRLVRPDGAVVWVLSQAKPHLDSDGRLLGYIGALTDLTDRKRSWAAAAPTGAAPIPSAPSAARSASRSPS